ncbi:hypothetical protein [Burkholderia ubonensis]|uniref:hypothetical protein n=1 Tax=Burkholderia ubonensis TaxID=101571 RepID=UPI0011602437|nr:hypothetical protein [Burkholderia ubonensis]
MSVAWPVPTLKHVQHAIKPPVWLAGMGCVFVLSVAAALVVLVWPAKHGSAAGGPFWVCLAGLPIAACLAFSGLLLHLYGMAVYRRDCSNTSIESMSATWQKWARRSVVVKGSSTLTAEDNLAEKIVGLEGAAPQNKTLITELKKFEGGFQRSRTELVFARLLEDLRSAIGALVPGKPLRIVVWTGADAEFPAIEDDIRTLWTVLGLKRHPMVEGVGTISWSLIEQHVVARREPLLIIGAQLHDVGGPLKQYSESGVALLFDVARSEKPSATPIVRLFRSMPTSIESVAEDIEQLGRVGPIPLERLRTAWNGGLGKAEGHALSRAIGDSGLILKGGANGIVNLSECIGPAGPISPWLSLGLAAELIRYGQGSQLLAVPTDDGIELAVASTKSRLSPVNSIAAPTLDLRGAGMLVCAAPCFGTLVAIMLNASDVFPWIMANIAGAGILAMVSMFVHPLLIRSLANRDVVDAGGRLPMAH